MALSIPKYFKSYTFVLSVIYAALFCASIIVVLTIVYFSAFQFLRAQTDQRIDEDVLRIVASTDWTDTRTFDIRDIRDYLSNRRRLHPKSDPSVYLLVDRNRNYVAGNLHKWPSDLSYVDQSRLEFVAQVYYDDDTRKNHPVRAIVVTLGNTGHNLLVGRDIMEIEALRQGYLHLFWWSIVAAVFLAILGAYWVSRIVSRRLERVNALSRSVMAGDLSQRVSFNASGDQFDDLADNINQMLERIQTLVEAIRSVSDNIAHDLRTPLTRLRNDLDEIARSLNGRTELEMEQAKESVEKAIFEADTLLRTFEALLRIARLENRPFGESFNEVSVGQLVEELIDLYGPIADSQSISLTASVESDSTVLFVDRDALAQALANLVDNALKYTPQHGTIAVEGKSSADAFEIAISDNGPGIPAEYHQEVLKRFVRLDDSSRTTAGNGLGLSLVAAVARMHNLELVLEDAKPGLRVRLKNFKLVNP